MVVQTKPPANGKPSATNRSTPSAKTKADPKSPLLGKTFISKSQDNLSASTPKSATGQLNRPNSSLGLASPDICKGSGKENNSKAKFTAFAKPKPVSAKNGTNSSLRKASSTQGIDKASPKPPQSNKQPSNMKRTQSSQNLPKGKSLPKRTSAPADIMAYNAELLANFEKEKKGYETRISELIQVGETKRADIEKYKYRIKHLEQQIPSLDQQEELSCLRNQNRLLKDHLKELGCPVEQTTDSEKLSMLMLENARIGAECGSSDDQLHTSASCDSLSMDGIRGSYLGGGSLPLDILDRRSEAGLSTDFGTPEHPSELSMEYTNWDKQSNKSSEANSEVSVANLTERIMQLDEMNYSTSEELQATLQELGDLQYTVNDLQEENERFADEKAILLESLCTQTEKLEHCRTQIDQLKSILISGKFPDTSEREYHLLDLLKGGVEEREELLRKQDQLVFAFQAEKMDHGETQDIVEALKDKVLLLEDKLTGIKAERTLLDEQLTEAKQEVATEQIEIARYKMLLDSEKAKVAEMDQCRMAGDESDMEELLHIARLEKDKVEGKLANAKEALAHCQQEVNKVKEQLSIRDEELKVSKNNAKSNLSDLEYKMETYLKERDESQKQTEKLRDHIVQLEQDCDSYLEEKKGYTSNINDLRQEIDELRQQKVSSESRLDDMKVRYSQSSEEWDQFQKDLQVAVVIANNFRAETQDDMDKIIQENTSLKERIKKLDKDSEKNKEEIKVLKDQKIIMERSPGKSILTSEEMKGKVLNSLDRELAALREGRKSDNKNTNLTVKHIIRSIEGSASHHSSCNSSRRSSDSTDGSMSGNRSDVPASPVSLEDAELRRNTMSSDIQLRSMLKKTPDSSSVLQRHSVASLPFDKSSISSFEPQKGTNYVSKTEADVAKVSPTISSILGRGSPRRNSGIGYVWCCLCIYFA